MGGLYIGFNYEFNSLQSDKDELSTAFRALIYGGSMPTTRLIVLAIFAYAPILSKIVRVPLLLFVTLW